MMYNLQSVLNRMGGNLSLIHGAQGGQSITTTGGNLFDLAQQYYGDPNQWEKIYDANREKVERGLPAEGASLVIPAPNP